MADETRKRFGSPERPPRRLWPSSAARHDEAVIQAEVRRLARALRPWVDRLPGEPQRGASAAES